MNKYIKLLNNRINKFYKTVLLVIAIQVVVCIIYSALTPSQAINSGNTNMFYEISDGISVIFKIDYIVTLIISLIAAISISIVAVRRNDIKFYLAQGVKRSTNITINIICALIISIAVTIIYIFVCIFSRIIVLSYNSDYMVIDSIYSALKMNTMWINAGLLVGGSMAIYFTICWINKLYNLNRTLGVVLPIALVAVFVLVIFFGGAFMTERFAEFIYSYKGVAVMESIVLVIALSSYTVIEMRGEITR